MPITHTDGQIYFSQAEQEAAIKERIKNTSTELATAQARVKELEPLAGQVEEWKGKAAAAEGGLARYQAATGAGVSDPDTIEALESAHAKAMKSVPKEKQVDFPTYVTQAKADPSLLPSYLRGVFAKAEPQANAGANTKTETPAKTETATGPARPAWAPAVSGSQPVATGGGRDFVARVSEAKTLDDIARLDQERRGAP